MSFVLACKGSGSRNDGNLSGLHSKVCYRVVFGGLVTLLEAGLVAAIGVIDELGAPVSVCSFRPQHAMWRRAPCIVAPLSSEPKMV